MVIGRQNSAKRAIKMAVKRGMALWGQFNRQKTPSLRVLTYHSVGQRDHEMNVTPESFAEQMEWLADHCTVVSPREAATGRPGVAVTFDDGYVDNLTHAAPVLARLGIPAAVFVVTGRMGGMLEHDTDAVTSRLLTWDQARELRAMGVEIGGHTMTHRRLSTLSVPEQEKEIVECARRLRSELGIERPMFAYPYGSAFDYDVSSMELVERAGFSMGFSNRYGRIRGGDNRWELRRIWIDETDTLETFQWKVTGWLDLMSVFESRAGLGARRMLNRMTSS